MSSWEPTESRLISRLLAALTLVAAAGCAAPPPASVTRVVANRTAADGGGTLVVLDVCLNYSPLAAGDYFVVANARQGATAIESVARQFLDAADLRRRTVLIPFVCGAVHDQPDALKQVADEVDGPVSKRAQPLWVAPELASDAEYVRALQTLATHVFRRSIADFIKDRSSGPESSSPDTAAADDERARAAASVVAQKSGHSSLLYVGITGNSLSSQKALALGAARVVAGVALSIAIGPVYVVGNTQVYAVFVPGGPIDKRQMAAGLIDLKQGRLVQSRVVGAGGDPMKPEVLAERNGLNLLLREMLLTAAP